MRRVSSPAALPLVAVAALAVFAAGCGGGGDGEPVAAGTPSSTADQATASGSASPTPSAAPVDPASVGANELGLVPVMMYHALVENPTSVYERTPAGFKAELEELASEDYVPITAADFVAGTIDVPAGKHPVVLTFDDSTVSQFALGSDGKPKAGTAVAILEQVADEHPGFTPTATFYVNNNPFEDGTGEATLGWLHKHGFEVGDHTMTHANLGKLGPAETQQEIAGNLDMIQAALPGYTPTTMALPFGISPDPDALAHHGTAGGTTYDFAGVFLVGAQPSHSPYHANFDPYAIPRVRSQDQASASAADKNFISSYYLPWLEQNPDKRFTSDGNPAKISFPTSYADVLAPQYQDKANPY